MSLGWRLAMILPLVSASAQSSRQVPGPARAPVEIIRDAFGVPHVLGRTSAAVMFGSGYAMADDRLAEIELTLRRANGRLAAIEGAAAVASDRAALQVRPRDDQLLAMYRGLAPEHRVMLAAFLAGINARIDRVRAFPDSLVPYEYGNWGIRPEPIRLIDLLGGIAVYSSWVGIEVPAAVENLRFFHRLEARYGAESAKTIFDDLLPLNDPAAQTSISREDNLAPPLPQARPSSETFRRQTSRDVGPAAVRGAAAFGAIPVRDPFIAARFIEPASRCFTIGPRRSATGHVLMQQTTGDGPEMHLSGGGFDVAGFSLLPLGTPVMGRGASHGWLVTSGLTNTNIETFAERLDPGNKFRYWHQGNWKDIERRRVMIAVKGAPADTADLAFTVHGPVIAWDVGQGTAYTLANAARGRELDYWVSVVEMGRAKTFADFERAVAIQPADLGICYGDESGRIAWWQTSRTPRRSPDLDPRLPTPGTGEYDWTGFLTAAEKPHTINPRAGYLYVWNGKPTPDAGFRDNWRRGKTYRTWVGHKLMASHPQVTPGDLRDFNRIISHWTLNRDGTDPALFLPALKRAVAAGRPELREAVGLIESWDAEYRDGDYDGRYDSAGLIVFQEWLRVAKAAAFDSLIAGADAAGTIGYRTELLLRLVEGGAAGVPFRHDYTGKPVDAFITQTLDSTLARVGRTFPGRPMTDWKQPVYWRYYDDARLSADSTHPIFVPEQTSSVRLSVRTSAKLGLTRAMVPDNGAEDWMVLM
ncbi:MAG: penicillin acylase family protein, partial [Gemmatimonadota bacterium]